MPPPPTQTAARVIIRGNSRVGSKALCECVSVTQMGGCVVKELSPNEALVLLQSLATYLMSVALECDPAIWAEPPENLKTDEEFFP